MRDDSSSFIKNSPEPWSSAACRLSCARHAIKESKARRRLKSLDEGRKMDTMKDRNVMLRDDRNLMATISLNDELQFNDHSSLSLFASCVDG